jgi:hypothetical protein
MNFQNVVDWLTSEFADCVPVMTAQGGYIDVYVDDRVLRVTVGNAYVDVEILDAVSMTQLIWKHFVAPTTQRALSELIDQYIVTATQSPS